VEVRRFKDIKHYMLTYLQLRKLTEDFCLRKKYIPYNPYPIINERNQDKFNRSIGLLIDKLELNGLKDKIDSKIERFYIIQPCVRASDFKDLVRNNDDFTLSYFEMIAWGEAGRLLDKERLIFDVIKESYEFLTTILGLDRTKLRVSYFGGGTASEITNGKCKLNYRFPLDALSPEAWERVGLKRSQIFRSKHPKDVFMLSLSGRFFRAGYRSEIFYVNNHNKEFEIGTLQYYTWRVLWKNNKPIKIKNAETYLAGAGFGIERLGAAVNNLNNVYEFDVIYPIYEFFNKKFKNQKKAKILADVIRATHRIIVDQRINQRKFSRHQREKLNWYFQEIYKNRKILEPVKETLRKAFMINAILQRSSVFKKSIELIIQQYMSYEKRRK